MTQAMPQVCAVLLAAGGGVRMSGPKGLLLWLDGLTLIEYQLRELAEAGVEETFVVLGAEAERLEPWVRRFPRARAVRNPDWETGKATSVVAGVRALPTSARAVFIVAVDQPRPREVLRALLLRHQESGALVTVPVYRGRRGHPVLFSAALSGELGQVRDESLGIRTVVERHRGETAELLRDDDIVLLDLNMPEVYQEAWRRLSRRP